MLKMLLKGLSVVGALAIGWFVGGIVAGLPFIGPLLGSLWNYIFAIVSVIMAFRIPI